MNDLKSIDGFVVLNVKYKSESSVVRQLFIKEHKVNQNSEQKPIANSLLVTNIPPFVEHHSIRHLFRDCGRIVDIQFRSKPTSRAPVVTKSKYFDKKEEIIGYKVCYVVFGSQSGLQKALNLSKRSEPLTLKPDSEEYLIGLKAMKQKYNESIVDSNELQKEINDFMVQYDRGVEEERQRAKESEGIPDADGWVKVQRHSKRKYLPNNQSIDEKVIEKHNKRRKKSTNDLKNFYSFQLKESKIQSLVRLRDRFEEDKKRIAIMKSQRKFKPF